MKRVSILAIAILSASFAQFGLSQATVPLVKSPDVSAQAKQDQKAAKAKLKADKAASKHQSGKKSTAIQDAAYALAYQKGLPKR